MGTWLVGAAVALLVGLALYKIYKDRKTGKGCGSCDGCPGCAARENTNNKT